MQINSKYIEKFKHLDENKVNGFKLLGNRILVERVTEIDNLKTKGLYIPTSTLNSITGMAVDMPQLYLVLMLGEGYYDETSGHFDQSKMERKVGELVILPKSAVETFGKYCPFLEDYHPDSIGYTAEDNCKFVFGSLDDFYALQNVLNNKALNEK